MALRFIVKLGGAAITDKNEKETLDAETLRQCALHLSRVYAETAGAGFIVVHGAGSFGHFQASEATVAHGQLQRETVRNGFVETR